jgi:putative component of membrane protein insertase Oxa1/YidC/SpoIIIJ protein YidD
MRLLNWSAILAIWVYQKTVSRFLRWKGTRCLHYPSCSQYAVLAYRKYDFGKATLLTWRRYRECNSFSGRPYIDFP